MTAAVPRAIIGLYGLLNYAVTRELLKLGIRLARGGNPRALFTQVLRRGVMPTGAGVIAGITLAARTLFARMLHGAAPTARLLTR